MPKRQLLIERFLSVFRGATSNKPPRKKLNFATVLACRIETPRDLGDHSQGVLPRPPTFPCRRRPFQARAHWRRRGRLPAP